MNKSYFLLIAFIIGEFINIVFLLPIINDLYAPFSEYEFTLRTLIWVCYYIAIPTAVGGIFEGLFLGVKSLK